ncbi:hypothetical protein Poli38472_009448 [Pythium oligandrum]|uniref:Tyrosinase copper-binding domain-containing protein n=1 Tax=Pythium oligandrum TaxID=41045 RepID=A0A8K1CFR2_PYTOL|nr:hypothetical protein Poli38472_009448 [Pythium oligandrum]|eukprot:TMW61955.1 hypothetical protein Poli38472_009448 [Pythium oligandrum]
MKFVFTLLLGAFALMGTTISSTEAQSCGPRVRKNWDAMTQQEKTTYRGALQAAMDSGAFIKFVEMHTEMRSEMEAHGQCMFIYWHRLFLVIFENMLRGQGEQYACVTLPYWDWITAHSRMTNGQCNSMLTCSSVLAELGGVPTTSRQRQVSINGEATQGYCVSASPLDHFCESGSVQGNRCVKCVPRGDWSRITLPGTCSYASVMNQIFSAKSIGEMSPNLELGAHNNVHANLDGTMGTFASPADPVFWSHHSMVDLLHTVFHKCRVGETRLTFEQKASHPVAWTSCNRRDGVPFNPVDSITMRTGVNGRNPIQGSQDPLIGRFFQGVPSRFADLMDIRDLGDSSYTYELSGVTATMYTQCDGTPSPTPAPVTTAPATRTPAPVTTAPPTRTPAPVTTPPTPVTTIPVPTRAPVTPAPVTTRPAVTPRPTTPTSTQAPAPPTQTNCPWWSLWCRVVSHINNRVNGGRWGRTLRETAELEAAGASFFGVDGNVAASDFTASINDAAQISLPSGEVNTNTGDASDAQQQTTNDPSQTDNTLPVSIVECEPEPGTQKVHDWYNELTDLIGGPSLKSFDEIERMLCVYQDECLGGVQDYSEEFKKIWNVDHPRCKTIVDEFNAGSQTFCVEDWRERTIQHLGCPLNTTAPASSDYNPAAQRPL